MARLKQIPRADAELSIVPLMHELLFGSTRTPVAETGIRSGTRGDDLWTLFAHVPPVPEHTVAGFRLYRCPQCTILACTDHLVMGRGRLIGGIVSATKKSWSQQELTTRDQMTARSVT